jgi:hypothetical protein
MTDDYTSPKPLPAAPPSTSMSPRPDGRAEGKRTVAAAFYSILAVLVLYHGIQGDFGGTLLGLALAAYAVYLWRGGRVVFLILPIWVWLPLAGLRLLGRRR